MILSPQQASALLAQPVARELGRLVVVTSPALDEGDVYTIDSTALTVGRGGDNDLAVAGDEYASARHARFEPRRDGVYVEDVGSTNGTFVNGIRLDARAAARARRRRPHRRDRPEVRAMSGRELRRGSRTPAASAATTRTRSSASRRSSRSPTAWAARRPARSPRRSPPSTRSRDGVDPARRRGARRRADPGGEPPRPPARARRRDRLRHGHDDDRRLVEADGMVVIGHVGDSRAYRAARRRSSSS